MSTNYIGLKLGSTETVIYKSGNGIVLNEASLIAMPTNPKIKEVKAVGNEAKDMLGRTSNNIKIYSPIVNGTIRYENLAVLMLKEFLHKVFPIKNFGQNIKAIVTAPLGLTPNEKKQIEVVCYKSGIGEVQIVPDIICSAIGNGIDIKSQTSQLIVNIGGDTTNIAIISNYSIIKGFNFSIGGSLIDTAITKYVEEKYNAKISFEQAEEIKIEICSLIENYSASIDVTGINNETQNAINFVLTARELFPVISRYFKMITDAINSIIQECNPEIVSDISKNGIYFYGGSTQIIGFEKFMNTQTNLKINVISNSSTNMLGAGEIINYPQLLKLILKNN